MYPENPQEIQVIVGSNMGNDIIIIGTEAEIQLPASAEEVLKIPASSSSLILVGWCEERHPATKNLLQLPQGTAALW